MYRRRISSIVAVVAAALLTTTGCQAGADQPQPQLPELEDVSGMTEVPVIQIITKPQSEDPTRFEVARLIAEAWTAAGIETTVYPVGTAQLNSLTATSKDFDVYIIGYAGTPERLDPDNFLSRFFSANATESGSNYSMYASEEFDAAYEAQLAAASEEDRVDAVHLAQQILAEDLPAVPLVYPSVGSAYRGDRWEGLTISASTPLFGVWNAVHATPTDDRSELVVGTTIDPTTLNPVLAANNQDLRPLQLIYDTALTFDPEGQLIENAVSSYDVDGATIELTVRDGMTFTDGEAVTGEDVAFSLEYLEESSSPLFASSLEAVESVHAAGQAVTIELVEPSMSFAGVVLANMPILPQHVWSTMESPSDAGIDDLIGSGPFSLDDRVIGQYITFSANPEAQQVPEVDALTLRILGNFDAAAGALESGQIDILNPAETVSSQYALLEDVQGVEVVHDDTHGWTGVHFNTSRDTFADLAFRQALTALLPIDDIIAVAYQGQATAATSVIAPTLTEWHDDSIEAPVHDPQAAMDILAEAGYGVSSDGTLYAPSDG